LPRIDCRSWESIILVFALLAVLGVSVHVAFSSKRRSTRAALAETYLIYLLFIYVGLMGVFAACGHVFRPVQTSASIGWLPSPYEYEVGMADLAVGVLGVLCLWLRANVWLATAIVNAVWMWGNAFGHIREIYLHNNHAPDNSGVFLITEIIMPVVILFLALYHRAHLAENQPIR
jgi:hypothetical protein